MPQLRTWGYVFAFYTGLSNGMDEAKIKFEEIVKKVERLRQDGKIDLSSDEDLSIAVMNLISLEEHFFFTGVKTGKTAYFDLLNEVRGIRKEMLGRLIEKSEGETWCVSKHLLATTMRLIEVGTKFQSDGKKDDAQKLFARAHQTYGIFWALRLKLIEGADVKKLPAGEKPWSYKDLVNKLVDCCDE